MSVSKTKIAIVGGGPTGLGAAWRLNELDEKDWLLLEGADHAGGLAGSIVDDQGFVWDKGGHVLFSHYEYFDNVLNQCLGDSWVDHLREAWVWMRDQFIPYPLQNNIWRLPEEDLISCLNGLLSVHNKAAVPLRSDVFEDWILRNFGKGLADIFFCPYNFKVWAYHPSRLSSCWIQERVATVDLSRILRNLVLRQDDLGWGPNSTFRFPLRGGTGAIWQGVSERLPERHMRWGSRVVGVDPSNRRISLSDGSQVEYEYLVSTMPLDQLLGMLADAPELSSYSDKFFYSSTNLVGIGLSGQPPDTLKTKCWIYFVEDQFPFYRITVFSNYSKYNVPKPGEQWSLLCEISESPDKPVDHANLKIQVPQALKQIGLIDDSTDIDSIWSHRLEYGYPTPFLNRDEILEQVDPKLIENNIFSRGRFGAWKYEVSNQDHSFMQGVEAINHILFGTEEMTYRFPGVVNSGKRVASRRLKKADSLI
jgi:protoporphyrinogen oxidase